MSIPNRIQNKQDDLEAQLSQTPYPVDETSIYNRFNNKETSDDYSQLELSGNNTIKQTVGSASTFKTATPIQPIAEYTNQLPPQQPQPQSQSQQFYPPSPPLPTHSQSQQQNPPQNPPAFDGLAFCPDPKIHSISTSDDEPDIIKIDNQKFYKHEIVQAFGGSLIPGYQPRSIYDFANPAPLGLCAFALTTFVSGLVDCETRGVTTNHVVVALAIFYGGFIQLLSGMWSIAVNNAFGGTALSSFGGFWMAYAYINTDYYRVDDVDPDAIAFFYLGWTLFSYMMTLLTFKSTIAFFTLFAFVCVTFTLLTVAKFTASLAVQKTAGVFAIVTSFIAWYNAFCGLANKNNSYLIGKVIQLPDDIFHNNHPDNKRYAHKKGN